MINPKLLRETPDVIQTSLANRGIDPMMFNQLRDLDISWRNKQQSLEELQALRNKSIPKGKPTDEERQKLSELSSKLKALQTEVNDIKEKLTALSFGIPNIIQDSTPIGKDETENKVIRTEGRPKEYAFTPKSHDELATQLRLIDFERATKISGSRFAIFTGLGSRLERAVSSFMLDTHVNTFGYHEMSPPVIINSPVLERNGTTPEI